MIFSFEKLQKKINEILNRGWWLKND